MGNVTNTDLLKIRAIKERVRQKSIQRIENVSLAIMANINANLPPYQGLESEYEGLLVVTDVLIEELVTIIKDEIRVEAGISTTGGDTTNEQGQLVLL